MEVYKPYSQKALRLDKWDSFGLELIGSRRQCRPKMMWKRTLRRDLSAIHKNWNKMKRFVNDSVRFKCIVDESSMMTYVPTFRPFEHFFDRYFNKNFKEGLILILSTI